MEPQKQLKYDNFIVEVYGGFGEVGGNCIVIRDGDRKLVFDYGIRYGAMRKYYGGRIEPLGPVEMIRLGVAPNPEVSENAQALYVSHLHLDHVGLLSTTYPSTPIVLPDKDIARATIGAWYEKSPRWLAYVLPKHWDSASSAKVLGEDKNSVIAIPVSHSAYPALAYMYMGKDAIVFYSGDFRLHPLVKLFPSLEESLQKLGVDSVDIAIIEGTNIGNPSSFMTRSGFEETLLNSIKTFDGVIVSVDPYDLESVLYIYKVAEENQRDIVIASERIYWMLRVIYEKMPQHINKTLTTSETSKRPPPIPLNSISLVNEVFKYMKIYYNSRTCAPPRALKKIKGARKRNRPYKHHSITIRPRAERNHKGGGEQNTDTMAKNVWGATSKSKTFRALPTPTAKTNNTDTQTKTFDTNTYRGTRTNVKTL